MSSISGSRNDGFNNLQPVLTSDLCTAPASNIRRLPWRYGIIRHAPQLGTSTNRIVSDRTQQRIKQTNSLAH